MLQVGATGKKKNMMMIISSEATSRSVINKFSVFMEPEVHYRINKIPSLIPVLSLVNLTDTTFLTLEYIVVTI